MLQGNYKVIVTTRQGSLLVKVAGSHQIGPGSSLSAEFLYDAIIFPFQ